MQKRQKVDGFRLASIGRQTEATAFFPLSRRKQTRSKVEAKLKPRTCEKAILKPN